MLKYLKVKSELKIFPCLLAGVLIFVTAQLLAAETDFQKLRAASANIKSIQADFTQKKFMKILSKPLVSEGRFYYAAPDSLRWEYMKPLKSVVMTNKNNTKRYIYAEGRMIEDKTGGAQSMKIVLNEVAGWMNGNFEQNPSFKATISGKTDPCITLTPTEKNMAGMIEKIEITLAGKKGVVKSVKIFEGIDNFTQINFKNIKTNAVIDPSVFQDIK